MGGSCHLLEGPLWPALCARVMGCCRGENDGREPCWGLRKVPMELGALAYRSFSLGVSGLLHVRLTLLLPKVVDHWNE